MLGGFRVSVGQRVIGAHAWHLKKAASLVKLLALAPGHRMHRERVMDLLWPDLGKKAASNNLRQTLHAARRALRLDSASGSRYLVSEDQSLVLCPGGNLSVDVEVFEQAAEAASRARDTAAYRTAIELYAGELLPEDLYEEWAEGRRDGLRQTHVRLLVELAGLYEERGEYGRAVEALRKATANDPTLEEAYVGLMRLQALSGRPEGALAECERLRDVLSRRLGTRPGAATRHLRDEIAAGTFPPTRIASIPQHERTDARKHNLPAPRTSFVGREHELVEVKRALLMTRLLTLTGGGGSGKTRLALEAARDLVGTYPDGVWLIELAAVFEGELLPPTLAEALGVPERPGQLLANTLVDTLRTKRMLLVLDNCEHLVEHVARFVDILLDSCPHLSVLATSREVLGLAGEGSRLVSPLSKPDPRQQVTLEQLERYESVRLFVERARYRNPSFMLAPQNAQTVAEICERLEGIPLAIELAAARVGLSVEQIATRLDDSLGLLSAGSRTASPRQRTLRGALDWSYDLLSEPERVLFGRLSVFAGGWTLEAAEGAGAGAGIEKQEVLDLLLRLVDKSLVVIETSDDGELRYGLLEPVRQYAQEKLEDSGEAEAVRRLHARFFLDFAEWAGPKLKGPEQVEWLAHLEEDNDNLRAAMAWLLEAGEVEAAVRLAWALWIFWLIRGHQGEGRRWIEAALAKGENLPAYLRARALIVQASTYYGLAGFEQLGQICDEAATLFRRVGDKAGLGFAVSVQATVRMQQGNAELAIELFEKAIELGRETGEKWGVSGALAHLGSVYLGQGYYEPAARYLEEALALSREVGNRLSESAALYGLALAEQGRGDQERAEELYTEGLSSSAEAGDRANMTYCLEGLAQVAVAQGEMERAALLFGAAEASLEAAGGALYAYGQGRSVREQAVNAIRSRLDEAASSAAWAKGRAMSPAETLEYALFKQERTSSGAPATPEKPSASTAPSNLTRREREVASLVARGLTNRQIASELSISEHTVANHVAKILRKLGFDSRSQVTVWVVEQRLL